MATSPVRVAETSLNAVKDFRRMCREKEQTDKKSRLFAGSMRKNRRFCLIRQSRKCCEGMPLEA